MSGGIRRVGVVGGGQMGAGIAEMCARAGLDTVVCEVDAIAARAAHERVTASLERAVQRGKLAESAAQDTLARLVFTGSLDDLADRQLVVEADRQQPMGARANRCGIQQRQCRRRLGIFDRHRRAQYLSSERPTKFRWVGSSGE